MLLAEIKKKKKLNRDFSNMLQSGSHNVMTETMTFQENTENKYLSIDK